MVFRLKSEACLCGAKYSPRSSCQFYNFVSGCQNIWIPLIAPALDFPKIFETTGQPFSKILNILISVDTYKSSSYVIWILRSKLISKPSEVISLIFSFFPHSDLFWYSGNLILRSYWHRVWTHLCCRRLGRLLWWRARSHPSPIMSGERRDKRNNLRNHSLERKPNLSAWPYLMFQHTERFSFWTKPWCIGCLEQVER